MLNKLFSPRYLFYTNTALGISFYSLGDCIHQNLDRLYNHQTTSKSESSKSWYDADRTVAMAKTGFILGAAGHFWYNYLDWKFPGTHFRTLAKKLAVEMMAGPPFALMTFVSLGFFEKKSLATSVNNFKDNLIWVCLVDYGFYVPLQFFNFKLVPPKYRFLYVACITIFYDVFLAFVLHKNDKSE